MRVLACLAWLAALGTASTAAAQVPVSPNELGPPVAWQKGVEDHFNRTLLDPYSAVKRQSSTVWRGQFRTKASWGKQVPSWAVCYAVNAKNAAGGYTGEQFYLILLHDSGAVREVTPSGPGLSRSASAMEADMARRECAYRVPPAAPKPFSRPKSTIGDAEPVPSPSS